MSAGAALEPWKLFQERAGAPGTGGGGDAERKREGENVRKGAFVESEDQVTSPRALALAVPFSCRCHELKSLLVDDLKDDFSDVLCHSTCVLSTMIYQSPYLTTQHESRDS